MGLPFLLSSRGAAGAPSCCFFPHSCAALWSLPGKIKKVVVQLGEKGLKGNLTMVFTKNHYMEGRLYVLHLSRGLQIGTWEGFARRGVISVRKSFLPGRCLHPGKPASQEGGPLNVGMANTHPESQGGDQLQNKGWDPKTAWVSDSMAL